MSERTYQAELATAVRATLKLSRTGIQVEWTPDVPRLKGDAWKAFFDTYRTWRDESIADFAQRERITIAVVDL